MMTMVMTAAMTMPIVMVMTLSSDLRSVHSPFRSFRPWLQIMCNYAKCVPITFHVSPDVSSHVMTDGEWVWQMVSMHRTLKLKLGL